MPTTRGQEASEKAPPAATKQNVIDKVYPRLRKAIPASGPTGKPKAKLVDALSEVIGSLPGQDFAAMLASEEIQNDIFKQAEQKLKVPSGGPAAAAASAPAAAATVDELLAAATATQSKKSAAAAPFSSVSVPLPSAPPSAAAAANAGRSVASTPLSAASPYSPSMGAAAAAANAGRSAASTPLSEALSPYSPSMGAAAAAQRAAMAAANVPSAAPTPVSAADAGLPPVRAPSGAAAAAPVPPSPAVVAAEALRGAPTALDQILAANVPPSAAAVHYANQVDSQASGSLSASSSAASMEASPAPGYVSPGAVSMGAEPSTAPGAFSPDDVELKVYPVTPAEFSERMGERCNEMYPAHGMAPVAWSALKARSVAPYNETYFSFVLATPSFDLQNEGSGLMGVQVAGVVSTYYVPPEGGAPGYYALKILDMGTRKDLLPKTAQVDPRYAYTLESLGHWALNKAIDMRNKMANEAAARGQAVPPFVRSRDLLVRIAFKQLVGDVDYEIRRLTVASCGCLYSPATHANPGAVKVSILADGVSYPLYSETLSMVPMFNPSETGPNRIFYRYRSQTGAIKDIKTTDIVKARMNVVGHPEEDASEVEFVTLGNILMWDDEEEEEEGAAAAAAAAPAPKPIVIDIRNILYDTFSSRPRRGGRRRRTTFRRSSSPRRKVPSSGRSQGYTRRRRA